MLFWLQERLYHSTLDTRLKMIRMPASALEMAKLWRPEEDSVRLAVLIEDAVTWLKASGFLAPGFRWGKR